MIGTAHRMDCTGYPFPPRRKECTEVYYILQGQGKVELTDDVLHQLAMTSYGASTFCAEIVYKSAIRLSNQAVVSRERASLMEPTMPFWFRHRQGKMEPAGPNTFRLTAPNLGEAFISIRETENGHWRPALRLQGDGPEVDAPEADLDSAQDAWEAAFELYRRRMVV